jgi:Beta-lactamase class C and other penicillin binding proteins
MALKNIGTSVMLIAAVFLAVVIVILPHNPTITENNTQNSIQYPLNPEIPQNSIINMDTNSVFLNVNAYSSTIFHNPPTGNWFDGTSSPDIEKVISLFNSYVENQFKNSLIPGAAVAVVYKDQIVYLKTLGVKKVGESDPINLETIFQIGSCSKAFTATTIASLVDTGLMTWNDTAQQYFPDDNEFTLQDPVATQEANMIDLLSHRSGMHDAAGNEHVLDFKYDFSETLYRMRYIAAESEFRTKYAYNNIMFSLACQSSARAASTTWPQLIKEKIYQPLNMDSSEVTYQEFVDNPNHSGTHVIYNGVAYYVDPLNLDAMGPAGSLSCSVDDMGNWLQFQLNNGVFNGQQVVSSQSLAETRTPQILVESNSNMEIWYALGWTVVYTQGRTFIAHAGSTRLSSAYTLLLPSEELGVVVMANEATVGQDFLCGYCQ